MAGRLIWLAPLAFVIGVPPAAAQGPVTAQSPTSPQPTIPKPMPDLDVPVYSDGPGAPKRAHRRHASHPVHIAHHRVRPEPIDRPALANVELLEPLPRPPEPPHVVVPTPAYPFEAFAAAFTTPPPPIVCRPTRYDRFKPDLGLVDERPVLCTTDNP